ncbi:MAG: MFS transporter [Clostridia bacterium]|nr:MFS transporter [Clostridia bacterium]
MKRLTTRDMIVFALGQLGWSMLSGIITNLLVNFYLPDATDTVMQEHLFITQGIVFIGLTVIGIITACGRLFDAVTDPLIASASDRCKSKKGKRIPFMRASALPFAIVTVLVFWCPVGHVSTANTVWLVITLLLFYLCMTLYCTPYNALIPVLGKHPKDRMNLSTAISVTYILGTGIAFAGKMIWQWLSDLTGMDIIYAARVTLIVLAVIALVMMWIPAFLIKETEYTKDSAPVPAENAFKSLGKTFRNKSFVTFMISDLAYWIAITMFNTGFLYYVENLLGLNNYLILFVLMTVVSFILYFPVNIITQKVGKKPMVIIGFVLFAILFLIASFAGKQAGVSNAVYGYIIAILAGFPMSILSVVPQAIVSDIAEADEYKTHENHDGMFFASRTFAMKIGQAVAMIIFTSVATIGQDAEAGTSTGLGYRITLIISLVCCVVAAIILLFYNEKKTKKAIQEGQAKLAEEHAAEEAALAAAGADGSVVAETAGPADISADTTDSGTDNNTDAG